MLLTLLVVPVLARALRFGDHHAATLRRTAPVTAGATWSVPEPRTWQITGNTVMSSPPG
jgi:hypothetical protein